MLSSIPVELQSYILAHLPRRDLASVVRTSQHFHAVGVKLLYGAVELRSLEEVEAFFQITSLLPPGSAAASRHADAKQDQWKAMKTLEIDISDTRIRTAPLANLPRSLRGRGVAPFPLDCLRLAYYDDPSALSAILSRFNPREVGLRRVRHTAEKVSTQIVLATGWKDVAHLTLVGLLSGQIASFVTPAHLPNVKSLKLVYDYWVADDGHYLRNDVLTLLRLFPNLDGLGLSFFYHDDKDAAEKTFQQGLAGKPASFFSVMLAPRGSNEWGEREDE